MQAHRYNISTTADIALTAATARTVLQLVTPASRKAWVEELKVAFESVTATDVPVIVECYRQSTAGSGSSAVTPRAVDEGFPAPLCTAIQGPTAEPTTGELVWQIEVTPIGGTLIYPWPEGKEPSMATSSRFGVVVTSPQAQNCRASLTYRE